MKKPFFSIITPTFNCLDYLKDCIQSVNLQTFQLFEHIIIDDGSTDKTKDYLLKNKTTKQKIIFSSHSGLPGIARNIGLKNSEGKYICFLDADDLFVKHKLELLYEKYSNNKVELIYHDEFATKNGKLFKLNYPISSLINKDKLIKFGNRLSTSTISIKKEFLQTYNLFFSEDSGHKIVEDYHFWLRILSLNPTIEKINEYLSSYRIHENGISSNKIQLLINEKNAILDLYEKSYINKNQLNFAKKRLELSHLVNSEFKAKNFLNTLFNIKNLIYFSMICAYRLFENLIKILTIRK